MPTISFLHHPHPKPPNNPPTPNNDADDLPHALQATPHLLNDNLPAALSHFRTRASSPFHLLGIATVSFFTAILGAEPAALREAKARLGDAEDAATRALARMRSYPTDDGGSRGGGGERVYEGGTEYRMCVAQAQMMAAVVGIVGMRWREVVGGLWGLRRAVGVLQGVAAREERFLEGKGGGEGKVAGDEDGVAVNEMEEEEEEEVAPLAEVNTTMTTTTTTTTTTTSTSDPLHAHLKTPTDHFIHDTLCTQYGLILLLLSMTPPAFAPILNIIGFRGNRSRGLQLLWRASASDSVQGGIAALCLLEYYNGLVCYLDIRERDDWPRAELMALLQTMRERYPRGTLWWKEEARMCSALRDLETCVSMLGPGRGPLGEVVARADDSHDSSSHANDDDTDDNPEHASSLSQIESLKVFERALDAMYLHAYSITASAFQKYTELSAWASSLYYYIAGAAELELYRVHRYGGNVPVSGDAPPEGKVCMANPAARVVYKPVERSDDELATQHKEKATALFEKTSASVKKKGFMGQQPPFDALITRKIQKWQDTAKREKIALVDAIGVSPFEEMQIFWSGYARMRKHTVVECLRRLAFSDGDYGFEEALGVEESGGGRPVDPRKDRLGVDDEVTLALLRGVAFRQIGKLAGELDGLQAIAKARTHLKDGIIDKYEWKAFKTKVGKLGDTWPLPMARYELAACLWEELLLAATGDHTSLFDGFGQPVRGRNGDKVDQCAKLLEEVAKWESYDLDAMMNMKLSTGRRTLKQHGNKYR